MEIKNLGLILYITATMLATFAVACGFETLRLFTNPVVIPAIVFYYSFIIQEKYNHWYGFVLFLCFIGDILVFLDLDLVLYIMIPYFLSYLILFSFVLKDVKNNVFNKKWFSVSLLIFVFLITLLVFLINSLAAQSAELVISGSIYGLFLSTYSCLGLYNFLTSRNESSIYLILFLSLSIFSDVFFVVFKLITNLRSLVFIEFCAQLLSYYFIVKYFSVRKSFKQHLQEHQINIS